MEHAISFIAREKAALIEIDAPTPPAPNEILGRTLFTLVSPGTELNWQYRGKDFPTFPGYAAVMEVKEVGSDVKSASPGQILFCTGGHRSYQKVTAEMALPVPPGLDPQHAVLARLMGVTMTTLATTEARPGEIVVVCGLGPVGFLAALSFRRAGYKVVGVDPFAVRRDYAAAAGLTEIYDHVPLEASHIAGKVGLVLECSGHEQAALDGCNIIRRLGEIVQVATPWTKMTDISAHTLLHTIFHKYAVVRSGWEWEIPVTPSVFSPVCIQDNLRTALGWIADGSVNVGNTISMHKPADAAQAYSDLSDKKLPGLFVEFDWR